MTIDSTDWRVKITDTIALEFGHQFAITEGSTAPESERSLRRRAHRLAGAHPSLFRCRAHLDRCRRSRSVVPVPVRVPIKLACIANGSFNGSEDAAPDFLGSSMRVDAMCGCSCEDWWLSPRSSRITGDQHGARGGGFIPAAYRGSSITSRLYCMTSPASSSSCFGACALRVASWRRLNP